MTSNNLAAALALAEAGWAVFPCKPSGQKAKAPMTTNGHLDATTDPDQIAVWWSSAPGALIGAPVPHTVIVLDIDPRNGGDLEALTAVVGHLPKTLTVKSGRNDDGRHLYYRRPPGRLSGKNLPRGVDLKVGGRGYCIMPPSLHPATGQPYTWEHHEIARLPDRAAGRLVIPEAHPVPVPRKPSRGRTEALINVVLAAPEGERNNRLFWAACRAHEISDHTCVQALMEAATRIGLTEREATNTILSAERATKGGGAH